MIYITRTEEAILKAYNATKCTTRTSTAVKKKNETVCRVLRKLVADGLLVKHGRIYAATGAEYTLVTLEEKMTIGRLPRKKLQVPMTDAERDWMLKNYHNGKRGLAAKTLGRTRFDIGQMALELGIDTEGRCAEYAKGDKGRSA